MESVTFFKFIFVLFFWKNKKFYHHLLLWTSNKSSCGKSGKCKKSFCCGHKNKKVTQLCSKNISFAEKQKIENFFWWQFKRPCRNLWVEKKISHNKILCKGGVNKGAKQKIHNIYSHQGMWVRSRPHKKLKTFFLMQKFMFFFPVKNKSYWILHFWEKGNDLLCRYYWRN